MGAPFNLSDRKLARMAAEAGRELGYPTKFEDGRVTLTSTVGPWGNTYRAEDFPFDVANQLLLDGGKTNATFSDYIPLAGRVDSLTVYPAADLTDSVTLRREDTDPQRWRAAKAVGAAALVGLTAFAGYSLIKDFVPHLPDIMMGAHAQTDSQTFEKILEDRNILEMKVSPNADRIVYNAGGDLKEFNIATKATTLIDLGDHGDGSVDTGIADGRFAFSDRGEIVYRDLLSLNSSQIKIKTSSGMQTLVSSDTGILSVAGLVGGNLVYTEYSSDSSGAMTKTTLFSKSGSAQPKILYTEDYENDSKFFKDVELNPEGTKIGFVDIWYDSINERNGDYTLRIMNFDGRVLKNIGVEAYPDVGNYIDYEFGNGKILSASIDGNAQHEKWYSIRVEPENGDSIEIFKDPLPSGLISDLKWAGTDKYSYINDGEIVLRRTAEDFAYTLVDSLYSKEHQWRGNKMFFLTVAGSGQSSIYLMDLAKVNHPPQLVFPEVSFGSPNSFYEASVGKRFYFDIDGRDADGDNLTFSDDTPLFNINPRTGIIDWTPRTSDVGTKYVNVSVSDGKVSDSWRVQIRVSGNNGTIPTTDRTPPSVVSVGIAVDEKNSGVAVSSVITDNTRVKDAYVIFDGRDREPLTLDSGNYEGYFTLNRGEHNFKVYGVDDAGNIGESPAKFVTIPGNSKPNSVSTENNFWPWLVVAGVGTAAAVGGGFAWKRHLDSRARGDFFARPQEAAPAQQPAPVYYPPQQQYNPAPQPNPFPVRQQQAWNPQQQVERDLADAQYFVAQGDQRSAADRLERAARADPSKRGYLWGLLSGLPDQGSSLGFDHVCGSCGVNNRNEADGCWNCNNPLQPQY